MVLRFTRSALVLVAAVVLLGRHATAAPDQEYRLKAAFIQNLIAFVEWPDGVLGMDRGAIEVAVLGRAAGQQIQTALAGKSAKGRPITVRIYDRASDIAHCHVLFVTVEAEHDMRTALRAAEGKPILTISEVPTVVAPYAVISIVIDDAHLAFTANLDSADLAGVRPASTLLRLARDVRGRRVGRQP